MVTAMAAFQNVSKQTKLILSELTNRKDVFAEGQPFPQYWESFLKSQQVLGGNVNIDCFEVEIDFRVLNPSNKNWFAWIKTGHLGEEQNGGKVNLNLHPCWV